jgi:hypothetical protein
MDRQRVRYSQDVIGHKGSNSLPLKRGSGFSMIILNAILMPTYGIAFAS